MLDLIVAFAWLVHGVVDTLSGNTTNGLIQFVLANQFYMIYNQKKS